MVGLVESALSSFETVVSSQDTLQISMLGDFSIIRDGGQRVALPQSKKTRALLGYLVLTGREHRRDRLSGLLWDVADDPRGALRWSLSKLRPLVNGAGALRIVADRETVRFEPCGARIDAIELRTALRDGPQNLDDRRLRSLANVHSGAFLEGLDLPDFHDFQSWCVAEREQLRVLYARALRELVGRLGAEPESALPYAHRLASLDPTDEEARATLVRLLGAAGRRAEAEQQVESGQRQMRELGVQPSGALAAAWSTVRTVPRAVVESIPNPPAPAPVISDDTPLVGRHAECARLGSLLDRRSPGVDCMVVWLTGEPGVGKTRLLSAFLTMARERGGTVIDGRAYEAESGRPYGAWIDALRRAPAGHAPDLSGASATQSREQLFASVVTFIGELRAPVVVALDDVQWLDEASAELLHYVARTARATDTDRPVVIAVTARSGEIVDNGPMLRVLRGLRRERSLEELPIGPLNEEHTAALVAAVAPGVEGVHARCAGNPLFALELARAGRRADGELPSSLADIVRERIERLSTPSGDVLRWAAALGRSADVAQLSALTALSTDSLIGALETLERHALLHATATGYAFAHDVVRQVVYAELSEPRRRLMHRRIAQELHRLSDTDGTVVADLARHASLAGEAVMAARACVDAGRRCLQVFATAEALQLGRRGAHYAQQLVEPERTRMLIDLWDVRLSSAYPEDPRAVASEIEVLAERAMDHGCAEHARLGFHLVSYLRWGVGMSSDAARSMLHAERVSRGTEGRERVVALAEAAQCLVRLERDLGDAEAMAMEARAVAARAGVEVSALPSAFGMLRAHDGELDEAEQHHRTAWDLARRARDRLAEFGALEFLVMLELRRGRLEQARRLATELVALGDKLREGSDGPCARALAAAARYAIEPSNRAEVDAALHELRTMDAKQRLSFALLVVAGADFEGGRFESALVGAKEALELSRVMKLPTDQAWARLLIARAAAALGDAPEHEQQVEALRDSELAAIAAPVRTIITAALGDWC